MAYRESLPAGGVVLDLKRMRRVLAIDPGRNTVTFEPGILAAKGSLYITRPTLGTYVAKHEDLLATARDLFSVVRSGKVKIRVNQTYRLADAAEAHRDLEARKTTGSTVLIP